MTQLPSYVKVLLDGSGQQFDPGVIESEMERGLSKLRVGQTKVVQEVSATLHFTSRADAVAFEDWYFNTIKRIGWFTWLDVLSGTTKTVRFKGGDIGRLTPVTSRYAAAERAVTLEYLR